MEEQDLALYAMLLSSSSVLPMVLKTAIDLGLFDILAESSPSNSLSASQIVSLLSAHDPSLVSRILRFLTSYSIVTCSVSTDQGAVYGLAPVAKYFTKNQDGGGSLAPLVNLFQDKVVIDIWYNLKDSVLQGGFPFNKTHGSSAVELVGRDSGFRQVFQSSMRGFNGVFMEEVLNNYKGFDGVSSLVDVGGGDGSVLSKIISKHPQIITAINFDLPSVINTLSASPGVENIAGDMFTSIPKGEAIFMKWMLHSWDDEHCVKILRNCYQSLPADGKVIVVDMVIPEFPGDTLLDRSLFQFELFMMNTNPSGKERTKREFEILARLAGFSTIQVPLTALCFSVVEFHKKTIVQVPVYYGEWVMRDFKWHFDVDNLKGRRMLFFTDSYTHRELTMAQDDYNLDKNTELVLTYSLSDSMLNQIDTDSPAPPMLVSND